jgi:predicted MFS family arabinose efflux permease
VLERQPPPPVGGGPPRSVLAAAFLFNLGQGVLRPSLPLFLQSAFGANYRMVTLIPVVFGAGRWLANLPTGYLLDRIGGTRLMVIGLLVMASCDVVSTMLTTFPPFLLVRGGGGAGWAMFGIVATSLMIDTRVATRRGRSISLLLTTESAGLLLGTAAGGWLYQRAGATSPFWFEAGCMVAAASIVAWRGIASATARPVSRAEASSKPRLADVLRVPGLVLMSTVNAALTGVQTGVLVFLFPLYLSERAGLSPDAVGYCLSLGVVGRLLTIWLGGALSDRYGRLRILLPGLIAYALVLVTLPLIAHPLLLSGWSLAIGAVAGLVASLPTAIIGDRVSATDRGVAIGWLRTATDAGMLLGPLVMGTLADATSLAAPFLCAAVILFALAVSSGRLHRPAKAST